ncbi:MAG TPA: ABC transporter ATP-binding protein [Burkholderiales bacterium]|nr:ABC transporter ATP-binding protein [Burkholderiales bacterium]
MSHIHADDLVVEFPIYGARSRSLKNTVIRAATGGVLATDAAQRTVVRAIDHLSFDWNEGDRIGLVGHNGSGKTTLLRALGGIYEPIGGSLSVNGRVASMLNLTLGMDDYATGYENIFIRGTILGLNRREIAGMVDEICEFSELGDFINMPMRTYSSGMSMRLAFTISTSVKADIILMDEWIGVGDEAFSEKAQRRLAELVGKAKILVLASHSPDIIRANCNKVVRLDHGRIVGEI